MTDILENHGAAVVATLPPAASIIAPANSPLATMMQALASGADPATIEKMMDLQARWQAQQAKSAYDKAFAAFKAKNIQAVKDTSRAEGPLKRQKYADLNSYVDAVTGGLSEQGLSSFWKVTKDEKDWIEVTCYLRHVDGHEESVSLGGMPDAGPGRNAIQARASTITYLQRYSLKAICGISEKGDDDDGAGGQSTDDRLEVMIASLELCNDRKSLLEKVKEHGIKLSYDAAGYKRLLAASAARAEKIGLPLKEKDEKNEHQ